MTNINLSTTIYMMIGFLLILMLRSFTLNCGRIFELNKDMNLNIMGGINYGSLDYDYYDNKDLSLPRTTEDGILYPYDKTNRTIQSFALEFKPSIDFNLDKYFGGRLFNIWDLGRLKLTIRKQLQTLTNVYKRLQTLTVTIY